MVEFHPAYHELMALSMRARATLRDLGPRRCRRSRAARRTCGAGRQLYMMSQAEAGHMCPITMTHAAFATLRLDEALLRRLQPKLSAANTIPLSCRWEKTSVTIGMGMTEKQGGTDVRANITEAAPLGEAASMPSPGINGSCRRRCAMPSSSWRKRRRAVLFPAAALPRRWRLNALRIERLKDKLGNRSNASSEVTFLGAEAELVGEEGRGVRQSSRW